MKYLPLMPTLGASVALTAQKELYSRYEEERAGLEPLNEEEHAGLGKSQSLLLPPPLAPCFSV